MNRAAAVQAARRRRVWMSQLVGFVNAPDAMRSAVSAILPTLAPDDDDDTLTYNTYKTSTCTHHRSDTMTSCKYIRIPTTA